MNWAERRKLGYIAGALLIIGVVVFLLVHKVTSVVPTCSDHKKNGEEVGIDCGGDCTNYCKNELTEPKVRWVRTFQITPGVVHAVAYVEHSYPVAAARSVNYQFKIYDDKNNLIAERAGSTFLGSMGKTAIVEILIPVGTVTPAITRFSFLPPVPWEKIDPTFSQIVINTDRSILENTDGITRLTATIENKSRYEFTNMDIVAILYDKNDNAITASKILLPELSSLGTKVVYFTWPFTTRTPVARIEVVPRFNPFAAKAL